MGHFKQIKTECHSNNANYGIVGWHMLKAYHTEFIKTRMAESSFEGLLDYSVHQVVHLCSAGCG